MYLPDLAQNKEIVRCCIITSSYYQEKRYPGGGINFLPDVSEIKKALVVAEGIYNAANKLVNI